MRRPLETPNFEERCEMVHDYLLSGECPCTYGKKAAEKGDVSYTSIPSFQLSRAIGGSQDAMALQNSICRDFAEYVRSGKGAHVFILDDEPDNHQAGCFQANRIFIEMMLANYRVHGLVRGNPWYMQRQMYIRDMAYLTRPGVTYMPPQIEYPQSTEEDPCGVFVTAMNPLYSETNPRYMPTSILFMSRLEDIHAVAEHDFAGVSDVLERSALGVARIVCPHMEREQVRSSADEMRFEFGFRNTREAQTIGPKVNTLVGTYMNSKSLYLGPIEDLAQTF